MARKKNVTDFRALADKPYAEYPARVSKPDTRWSRYATEEQKKAAKDAYKANQKAIEEVAMTNLDILISKLLVELDNRKEPFDFIGTRENCKMAFYGKEETKNLFNEVERAVKATAFSIGLKDLKTGLVKMTKNPEYNVIHASSDESTMNINLFNWLPIIAQAYNVDPHWFAEYKDNNPLYAKTYYELYDEWYNTHHGSMRDSTRNKLDEEAKKLKTKAIKAREKFSKTARFAALFEIIVRIEQDLKAADDNYKTWAENVFEIEAYNAKQKKLLELELEVMPLVEEVVMKEYHEKATQGSYEVIKKAAAAMYETGEKPQIIVKDSRTSSWLAGMVHYVTVEVLSADGTKSFGKVNLENEGLGNTPGFGPWD